MRWDGAGYHRVSSVQERWGLCLVQRVPAGKYRQILDAGCGTGRVTAHLLRAFPESRVVGLDRSEEMLEQALRTLHKFRRRLELVRGDLLTARPGSSFDLIFSNATFHWVLDQRRLFENLYRWLGPGGRIEAQCGGRGNLKGIEGLTSRVEKTPAFRDYFLNFRRPVIYASPTRTRELMREAGFQEIRVWLSEAPTRFSSRGVFSDFLRNVILIPNLALLPSEEMKIRYVESFLEHYESRYGRRYLLDYVRLNISAVKH